MSTATEANIRHVLQRLAREATDAAAEEYVERMRVGSLFASVMEAARLVERYNVEQEHVRAMALRNGLEDGNLIRFEYQGRRAEVYPNAHNKGATFGLRTNEKLGSQYDMIDKFHGADWTREAALAAGKAWVNDGVKPGERR